MAVTRTEDATLAKNDSASTSIGRFLAVMRHAKQTFLNERWNRADELRAAGCTVRDLKDGGYSAKELRDGGYSAAELRNADHPIADLRKVGFAVRALRAAKFTCAELANEAGCSVKELVGAGFAATDLKAVGDTLPVADTITYMDDETPFKGHFRFSHF